MDSFISWIGGKKSLRKTIIEQFPEGTYNRYIEVFHIRLKEALKQIKGKFVLSYNDCEHIRELYKECTILEVERQHNLIFTEVKHRYKELIIKNF